MRHLRLSLAAMAALCTASAGAQAVRGVIAEPVIESVPCDYGESDPRLPAGNESRAQLYDLVLGQRLRSADQRRILAELRARYPGEATEAFVAMAEARPSDSDESIRTFEAIVHRLGRSPDPDARVEVARARWMLAEAWRSRHVGEGKQGEFLDVSETYRKSAAGRRWSRLLDEYLRDYRGRGPAFDEFVAPAEYLALSREIGDRTAGDYHNGGRLLDPRLAELRKAMREKVRALIPRFEASPDERVQRIVADARDMLTPHELGSVALIPFDRALIERYRGALDYELRASVNGAYEMLKIRLAETGATRDLAAVTAEHEAWKAANFNIGCASPPPLPR